MPGEADIAAVAALLADPTRVTILLALSDGRALTTSELAKRAKVAPSTASEHLARLVDSSLLIVEKQGRNRFYRLADDQSVTEIMEGLARLAPRIKIRTLSESERAKAVYRARMCYNHLAGTLGARLSEALVEKKILGVVEMGYIVEDEGIAWLENFGIPCQPLKKGGLLLVPWHIDWSEDKHHVAGALGTALAQRLFELKWIKLQPNSRALFLTERGRSEIERTFGFRF